MIQPLATPVYPGTACLSPRPSVRLNQVSFCLIQASLRTFIILLVLMLENILSNAHISTDVAELATVYLSQTDMMSPLNFKCKVKLDYA